MTIAIGGGSTVDGPPEYTYAGLLVRLGGAVPDRAVPDDAVLDSAVPGGAVPDRNGAHPAISREAVLDALVTARFTGWLGPAEPPWVVAVARNAGGSVAGDRTGLPQLAARIAADLATVTLGVAVVRDRALRLSAWSGKTHVGDYDSDPTVGKPDDDETMPDPVGAEHAGAFATAFGRPSAADDLGTLLAEDLDRDSVFESERLKAVLRLMGMPTWLVAADSLPRDVPGGPRSAEVTRLGAGTLGAPGVARGAVVDALRRRRRPRLP